MCIPWCSGGQLGEIGVEGGHVLGAGVVAHGGEDLGLFGFVDAAVGLGRLDHRPQHQPGGGFRLARRPDDLSVADMITVLEGPVALTECQIGPSVCQHEGNCSVQEPWSVINRSVQNTLATITLSDIVNPNFPLIQVTSPQ